MWAGRFLRGFVALAVVLLLGATVLAVREAQAAELHNRALATRVNEMTRGRYREHVFTNVEVTHDVVYDGMNKLDIYAPAHDTDRARAAVVWFHPGGFTEGDKLKEAGFGVIAKGTAELKARIETEVPMWKDVIQKASIRPQ